MGNKLPSVIASFDSLTINNPSLRLKLNNGLFGFGSDDTSYLLETKSLVNRKENNKLLNGVINALAFVNSYDAAKNITYTNDEQIKEVETNLAANYDTLVNSATNSVSDEMASRIDEIRLNGKKFFDQERLNVSKVVTITTNEIPLNVLVYQYYGSLDNWENLLTLNSIYKPERVKDSIKIFET